MKEKAETATKDLQFTKLRNKENVKLVSMLLHILVLLPFLFMILNLDLINTGRDTLTHIYKAWILKQQIQTLPPWLWGQWDWTWYLGNPFLRTYSPLPYYILAFLSLIIPFWTAAKIILGLITPLAYISTYKALKHFTQSEVVSIVFAAVYIYSPAHIIPLYMWGSIGQALTTILIPQYFVQLHKTVKTKPPKNIPTTATMLASIILLNMAVGFWIVILTSIWIIAKKQILNLFKVGIYSFSLTASFLYAFMFTEGAMLPVITPLYQTESLLKWLKNSYKISFLHIELTIAAYIGIALAYLLSSRSLKEKFRKPHWEKIFEINTIIIIITLILSTLQIYPFSIIGGDRVLTTSGFLITFIGAYYVSKLKNTRNFKAIIIMLILITLLTRTFYQPYASINPKTYNELYQTIKEDSEWFRVLFLPREPWGAVTPLYTNHPTLNGWYPQCLPPEIFNTLGSLMTYDKYAYLEKNITENPEKTINTLKYLGVKYIIVDASDPIYPELTKEILQTMLKIATATNQVTLVKNHTHEYLFRIENYTPIHALTYIPQNKTQIPWKTEKINKTQIIQKTDSLEIRIETPKDYWIIIPIMYDKNLKITLDNQPAQTKIAYPRIIAVKTPKGSHIIKIQITTKITSKITTLITFTLWTTTIIYITFRQISNRIKRNTQK